MWDASPEPQRSGRREFLAACSAAAAAGWLGGKAAAGAEQSRAVLPTVALGPYRVTRLIAGANPTVGYSYLGPAMDQEMRSYFTTERKLAFLQQCEREGINTHQFSQASEAIDVYRRLREQGSKLQLICLNKKREEIKALVEATRPIAMAHHGGVTDALFREGRSGAVHDFVKAVHDAGLLAGVSAHNPDCIKRIADEGWPVDFFMTCFHFLTRQKPPDGATAATALEGPAVEHAFYGADRVAMCEVIRRVKQPCLAFKILGAGRRCASQETVREAFRFAFSHIKPGDAVIVGMYPRRCDQVRANAKHTRDLAAVS
jgi:thiamine monophosphate synthase